MSVVMWGLTLPPWVQSTLLSNFAFAPLSTLSITLILRRGYTRIELEGSSMSNEVAVRRSSRSNKGQHPKLEEDQLDVVSVIRPGGPTSKKKQSKAPKSDASEDSNAGSEEEDGTVNCVCGAKDVEDGDERPMCECEKCLTWQHVGCMFGSEDPKVVPEGYLCHTCKDKGSSEEIESVKKDQTSESVAPSISPSSVDTNKPSSPTVKQHQPPPEIVKASDLADKVRQSVALALKKILVQVALPEAADKNALNLPGQMTEDGFAERLALKIEDALYTELANKPVKKPKKKDPPVDVGPKYRDKFRTLSFNLRDEKNPTLRSRIIKGELTPKQIVTLTTEEMLNPELQKLAESVRQESIRDSVLKVNDAPRIRRTHKGDEIVETNEDSSESTRHINSNESTHGSEEIKHKSNLVKERTSDGTKKRKHVEFSDHVEYSDDREKRQRSVDYDQQNYAMDDVTSYSPENSPEDTGLISDDDLELDSVLNESNNVSQNTELSKSADKKKEEIGIWVGNVTMPGMAQFPGSAFHLQGTDNFSPFESWSEVMDLNEPIVIDGRLDENKAGTYLYAIRQSKSLVSFVLRSDEPSGDQTGFNKVFDYYHSRKKVGVIKNKKGIVRDAYIVTIANTDPIPAYLALDEASEEQISSLQAKQEKIIVCLFVVTPFTSQVSQKPAVPSLPVSTSSSSNALPQATASGVLGSSVAASASNLGLNSKDFDILRGILARNPEVAGNPQLPNNPQMLLDLLQQTQGTGNGSHRGGYL